MSDSNKSEINLEICSGFFRISTDEAVYNITVLGSPESRAHKVVGAIVDQEKRDVMPGGEDVIPEVAAALAGPGALDNENYYKQVSNEIYKDIGQLAKSLSVTIMDIPMEDRQARRAELDEAGEKIEDAKNQLKDIVSMTEKATMEIMDHVEKVQAQTDDVRELLSMLKNHPAFKLPGNEVAMEEAAGGRGGSETLVKLKEKMTGAGEIVTALREAGVAGETAPAAPGREAGAEKKTRHLFQLDVIFQTLYELCTNETVKAHITTAREQAADIFDQDSFLDRMSARVESLEKDADNFFTVPLGDLFQILFESCTDKKIKNLLKKMDTNQGDIFLDANLPLEAPPTEEVEVAAGALPAGEKGAAGRGPDPRLDELADLVEGALALAGELDEQAVGSPPLPSESCMTKEDQNDIFKRIGDAFEVAANICTDVNRITEALSFQDLSGQQIMRIIKLLSDFQIQLLAIVVSFGSQLKNKERDATITPEESKKLAQEDVDNYLKALTAGIREEEGPLDQESVNRMLEQLGF